MAKLLKIGEPRQRVQRFIVLFFQLFFNFLISETHKAHRDWVEVRGTGHHKWSQKTNDKVEEIFATDHKGLVSLRDNELLNIRKKTKTLMEKMADDLNSLLKINASGPYTN